MIYNKPKVFGTAFTCPHCGVLSKQDWWKRAWDGGKYHDNIQQPLRVGTCQHCHKPTVWVEELMCYPDATVAPPGNAHMPPDVLKLYQEAASIAEKSPRGAAALLRLAIQHLCKDLGEPGESINTDIASLVAKGLPPRVQQSLDVVRVTGNNAVHPGKIDVDDPIVAQSLFSLVNLIVEYMIAKPKEVEALFNGLPADNLKAIADRDKPKP